LFLEIHIEDMLDEAWLNGTFYYITLLVKKRMVVKNQPPIKVDRASLRDVLFPVEQQEA